jgi:proteasome assembly chaperone (PAC2) family protein
MAAYVLSSHESRLPVVGTATDAEMAKLLEGHGVELLDSGMIVGMNGLLVGLAWARGLKGFCLLGATEGGLLDVHATEEVLNALARVLGFKLDLSDIHAYASAMPRFRPPRARLPGPEEEISYIR